MDNKANDWILSTMANPSFTATDFINAGITSNNTSIYERDRYLNSTLIQDSPEFLSNGRFDKAKFNDYYDRVLGLYQELAEETSHPDTAKAIFSYNNVWVSEDLRKKGLDSKDFLIKNIYNPDKRRFGIERIGYTSDPTMTPQEIALNEKVWDPATKTWSESPNDSWLFRNWFDPVALATWEFDADINGNPTNDPSKIYYLKGQPKVNEKTGTYYYEKLNGKEPYGKLILSPFDIITKDGSVANKYDFFDSDSLDKSFVGSLAKNAMRIAPLFIPYVNTAYVAFNIADEMAKVLPIIYKSTFGLATDDHSIANTIEAFAMQFDNNKVSEAGQQSFFNSESTLNMISDVALLLYELRWLFTKAPKVFKMKQYDISKKAGQASELEKATEAKAIEYMQEMAPTRLQALLTMLKLGPEEMKAAAFEKSERWAAKYMKDYQNVGRNLSRLFMAGTSSFLAYQDAKEEGASDLEAAALFWGYFSGMYALMGTDIGEHVLPELRLQKLQIKDAIILVARGDLAGETVNATKAATETAEKVGIFKKMFDKGASFARTMHNRHAGQTLADTAKSIGANMLAEGVEEVTEELLYDVTKSTFNILSEFSGGTKVSAWDNILERYGQSFFGGMIGGGIFEATNAYHIARPKLEGLEYDPNNIKANQMLIYLIRNGEKEELMNSLNYLRKHKMLGNANLGTKFIGVDKDGNTIYSEATDTDNQNEAAYQLMLKYINNIETVLDKENMNLSDSGLIAGDGIEESDIMKSLRYNHLMSSPVVGKLLLDYNNLADKFLLVYNKIQQLESVSDEEKRSNPNWQEELDLTKKELEELRKQREEYFSAENQQYYTGLMLWAGNANMVAPFGRITFRDFAEDKYHKKFNELTDYERERAQGEYQEYLNGSATDEITRGYDLFMKMNKLFGQLLMLLGENAKNYVEGRKAFMNLQINILLPNPETNELEDVNVSIQDLYDLMFKTEGLTDDLLTKKALELSKLENPFDVMRRFTITGDGSISLQLNAWFNPNVAPIVGTDLEPLLDESDPASQMARQKINLLAALRDNLLTLANSNQGGYVDSELMDTILEIKDEITKIDENDLGLIDFTENRYKFSYNDDLVNLFNRTILTGLNASNFDLRVQELIEGLQLLDDNDLDVLELKDLIREGKFENFKRSNQEIFALNDEINQIALNATQNPIYDLLSQIIVTTTGEERNVILLLKDAETRFKLQTKGGEVAKFILDGDLTREDFENALLVIEQVKSLVRAALTDPLIKDNIMDFNRLMNMISGSQELGEIDSTSAYTFYQDLNQIESKILFIISLDEYNSRQSLMELTRLGTKLDLISFNIIGDSDSEFYKVSPGVDKLIGGEPFINEAIREAIEKAETLEKYSKERNPVISTEELILISKERMAIENAIYDRVQELLLNNTPEEVYSVIFKKYIDNKDQLGVNTTNITKDTDPKNITMMGELTYLMSIIGYKSGDFHYLYKLWMDNNDTNIIPLPAQRADIQFVWTIAHNKEFLNTLETLLKTEDNNKPPVLNTVLVQGVSGAGKTSAVMMIVYLMLKNNSTTPIKTITAGPLKNQAEKLATDINVDVSNNTVYDKEELIKNLLGITVEELNKVDSWDFTITSRPDPENDKVERKLKQSIVDGFNNQNPPNYIFIDEVTFFTASELYALGEYCKRNNILLITAGDLKQGKTNKTWDIPGYNNIIDSIDVTMIPSPWELTCSMRPSNVAKRDNNILSTKIVEQYTWGILNGQNPDIPITNPRSFLEHLRTKILHDAKFIGALSDSGLKGEVLRQRPSSSRENGNSKLLPAGKIEVVRTLKLLIRNLGEGEKIAYVYDPTDTSIKDFIENSGEFTLDLLENQLELKSTVDFFQEKSIQGSERKYCIVDINWKENYLDKLGNLDADQDLLDADLIKVILDFLGSFNTVISRSIHGSIIYDNGLSELLGHEAFLEKDIATINDIKPNTLMLQAYNETQKGIYESLLEGYTPSENATSEQTTGETPVNTTNTGGTTTPTVNPLTGPTVRLLSLEILYFTPNLTSLGRGTIGLVYVLNRKGIYVPTHAGFNTVYITESGNRLTGGGLFPGPEALALRRNILVNDGAGGWFELSVDTVEKVLVGGEDCTFRTKEEVVAYQARFNSIETTSLQNPQPEPSTGGLGGTDDGNPTPSGDEIPQGNGPTIAPLPEPDPETPPQPLTGGGQPPITNGEVLVLTLDLLLNNLDAIRNSYDPSTLNLTLVRYLTEKQYDDYRDGTLKTGPYVLSFNTVEELVDSIRDGGFKYTVFSILVTPKTSEAYRATGKTKRSDFEKFKILLYNTKDPSNVTDYLEQQWYSVVEGGNKKYYKITKLINNGENTLCNVSEYDLNGKYTGSVIKNIPLGVLALKNLVKCESPIQPSLRSQRTAGTGVNDLTANRVREIVIPSLNEVMNLIEKNGDLGLKMYSGLITQTSVAFLKDLNGNYLLMLMGTPKRTYTMVNGLPLYNLLPENLNALLAPFVTYDLGTRYNPTTLFIAWNNTKNCLSVYDKLIVDDNRTISDTVNIPSNFYEIYKLAEIALANIRTTLLDMDNSNPTNLKMISDRLLDILYLFISQNRDTLSNIGLSVGNVYLELVGSVNVPNAEYSIKLYNNSSTDREVDRGSNIVADDTEIPKRLVVAKIGNFEVSFAKLAHSITMMQYLKMILLIAQRDMSNILNSDPQLLLKFNNSINQFKRIILLVYKLDYMTGMGNITLKNGVSVSGVYGTGQVGYIPIPNFNPSSGKLTGALIYGSDEATTDYLGEGVDYNEFTLLPGMIFSDPAILTNVIKPIQNISDLSGAKDLAGKPIVVFTLNEHLLYYQKDGKYYFTLNPSDSAAEGNTIYSVKNNKNVLFLAWRQAYTELLNSIDPQTGKAAEDAKLEYNKRLGNGLVRFVVASPKAVSFSEYVKNTINLVNNIILDKNKKTSLGNQTTGTRLLHTLFNLLADLIEAIRKTQNNEPVDELRDEIFIGTSNIRYKQITIETLEEAKRLSIIINKLLHNASAKIIFSNVRESSRAAIDLGIVFKGRGDWEYTGIPIDSPIFSELGLTLNFNNIPYNDPEIVNKLRNGLITLMNESGYTVEGISSDEIFDVPFSSNTGASENAVRFIGDFSQSRTWTNIPFTIAQFFGTLGFTQIDEYQQCELLNDGSTIAQENQLLMDFLDKNLSNYGSRDDVQAARNPLNKGIFYNAQYLRTEEENSGEIAYLAGSISDTFKFRSALQTASLHLSLDDTLALCSQLGSDNDKVRGVPLYEYSNWYDKAVGRAKELYAEAKEIPIEELNDEPIMGSGESSLPLTDPIETKVNEVMDAVEFYDKNDEFTPESKLEILDLIADTLREVFLAEPLFLGSVDSILYAIQTSYNTQIATNIEDEDLILIFKDSSGKFKVFWLSQLLESKNWKLINGSYIGSVNKFTLTIEDANNLRFSVTIDKTGKELSKIPIEQPPVEQLQELTPEQILKIKDVLSKFCDIVGGGLDWTKMNNKEELRELANVYDELESSYMDVPEIADSTALLLQLIEELKNELNILSCNNVLVSLRQMI